jgi:tetratricopeptide (TPR) repeat protein
MQGKKASTGALSEAKKLLQALHDRNIEAAYKWRDRLVKPDRVNAWIHCPKDDLAVILYALGQVLSRNCCESQSGCKFEMVDGLLGINYAPDSITRPKLQGYSLETAARVTFYYGVSALHRREYKLASNYFSDVLHDASRLDDYDLLANAHFYLGTSLRKLGLQHSAVLEHLNQAESALRMLPSSGKRILVVEIHKAWEDFVQGKFEQAADIARQTVHNFGTDFATRAHAEALLARIERRRRNYHSALKLTKASIRDFRRRDPYHRALARAHSNLAHTMILMAQRETSLTARKFLLNKAAEQLGKADEIYGHRHFDRGTRPEVQNLRAEIELEQNHYEAAFRVAEQAYIEAKDRCDRVEMSTARILQCICLIARPARASSDGAEKAADKIQDITEAHSLAKDAVQCAESLGERKHPRRTARAYIWLGRVLLLPPFMNLPDAIRCRDLARDLLPPPQGHAGYIGEELDKLSREIEDKLKQQGDWQNESIICEIKYSDVLNRPWSQTKQWLAETIIGPLVNNRTDDQIIASIKIRPAELSQIKQRCISKGLVSKLQIDKRKGRKKRAPAF